MTKMSEVKNTETTWQETINVTPFVERIEDAIMNLGHESAVDFEILAYRIGQELATRYCHVLDWEEKR